jgi:hypothetical protein
MVEADVAGGNAQTDDVGMRVSHQYGECIIHAGVSVDQ